MIGGHDVCIPTVHPAHAIDAAVRVVCAGWSEAIVDDAHTGATIPVHSDVESALPDELFIYANLAARESWSQHGATSENANTMIHLIASDDSLTIVVDDPLEPKVEYFLSEIRERVNEHASHGS